MHKALEIQSHHLSLAGCSQSPQKTFDLTMLRGKPSCQRLETTQHEHGRSHGDIYEDLALAI